MTMDIHSARIKVLNKGKRLTGRYVLYWMQQSCRADFNHALEYAIGRSNEMKLPVVVCFGITPNYPEATARSYLFMLQGIMEMSERLAKRGIRFILQNRDPFKLAVDLSGDAALIVTDRGYLRIQKQWREYVAQEVECPLVQVESDVIVPVEWVSEKQEYAARTIRPKIHKLIPDFLELPEPGSVNQRMPDFQAESIDPEKEVEKYADNLKKENNNVNVIHGGYYHALKKLYDFTENRLDLYDRRNDPSIDLTSGLSPYIHFGQISPLEVALAVMKSGSSGADLFLEELIVRRELAVNFVNYNSHYDSFEGIPGWAAKSLDVHESDMRPYLYSETELREGRTHDEYWNSAQRELVMTGRMHSYMRMYWCKKIIEWTQKPVDAFNLSLKMNNEYALDGRDPSSYTGVSWCFGTHDRPWKERPVFGMVRYMAASGLERKFDIKAYVKRIEQITPAIKEIQDKK